MDSLSHAIIAACAHRLCPGPLLDNAVQLSAEASFGPSPQITLPATRKSPLL